MSWSADVIFEKSYEKATCRQRCSTNPGLHKRDTNIYSDFFFACFRPKSSVEDGYSDGEEDFYFNEIGPDDEYNDSVFPPPLALSPTPTQSHFDMVKSPWSEPGVSAVTSPTYGSLQHPRFNWDAQAISQFSYTQSAKGAGKVNHPARVLSHPGHHTYRKLRGESKKCRKVYGMENRHMWCTQCRWKKACVRFADWTAQDKVDSNLTQYSIFIACSGTNVAYETNNGRS